MSALSTAGLRRASLIAALVVAAVSRADAQALSLQGPGVDPSQFRVTTYATGLNFPQGMVQLSDGSLLVATTPPGGSGTFLDSTSGQLLRFTDPGGTGVASGPGQVLYTFPSGTMTSMQMAGNLLYALSSSGNDNQLYMLRPGASPSDPFTLAGTIDISFPSPWPYHFSYSTAIRPDPGGGAGNYDLFFNVGSQNNATASTLQPTVSGPGLSATAVNAESIYEVLVHDTGSSVSVSGLTQIASGLRNAAGMAFQPSTGNLYFNDNGIDGNPASQPVSADTLHVITAASLGQSVPNYGFPNSYVQYGTNTVVGSGAVPPLVAFQPLNGTQSVGPEEISMAPSGFPAGLNNGIFIGFHGSFADEGTANDRNPLVYYNLSTGQYFDFVGPQQAGIGHLDSLLASNDGQSLFVADYFSTNLAGGQGVIYEITAVPEPSSFVLLIIGGVALARRYRDQRRRTNDR